jgi:trehalose-phosphatase
VQALAPPLVQLEGAMLEDKQWTLSVHYRGADDAIVPPLRALVGEVASHHGLRVREGKKVFEIRPPVNVTKGTAIERLVTTLGGSSPDASLLFAGDDATDEDAFQLLRLQLPRAVTIHVGDDANTAAEYTLSTPEQLRVLLERIAHEFNHAR